LNSGLKLRTLLCLVRYGEVVPYYKAYGWLVAVPPISRYGCEMDGAPLVVLMRTEKQQQKQPRARLTTAQLAVTYRGILRTCLWIDNSAGSQRSSALKMRPRIAATTSTKTVFLKAAVWPSLSALRNG